MSKTSNHVQTMKFMISFAFVLLLSNLHSQTIQTLTKGPVKPSKPGEMVELVDRHSEDVNSQPKNMIAVFIGTVKSIKRTYHKEGEFDFIRFRVDTILQLDTAKDRSSYDRFLCRQRKKAFVMDEPSKHRYKVGSKYKVFIDRWNVDYYSSNPNLTFELK